MKNFNYSIPTEIFFGEGQIKVLPEQIKRYGSKVLLVYGGGSIKKNGVYSKVIELLNSNDIKFWELSGVDPNPRITSVRKGIQICREHNIDFILPVGGGSSIDCSKVIAAGYYYDGEPWDIVLDSSKIRNALPIGAILTLAATGSEMNAGAVITNMDTNEKLGTGNPSMKPKFSILDPTYTFTVPKNQTAAGTVDIMSHVFENYFSSTKGAYVQNRLSESILKTCIQYGKLAMEEPENYEARANLMWASSLALNGLLGYGKESRWSVHPMEHELSAYYDITHGVGLGILTPYWMEYVMNETTIDSFVEYGVNVWGINPDKDKLQIAKEAIERTKEFFISLDIPMHLKEVGIGEEKLETMAKAATRHGSLGLFRPLDSQDVLNIFKAAL